MTTTKRYVAAVVWVALIFSASARAIPQQVLSVDVGFGLPELYTASVNMQLWRRWQVGLGYGYLPSFGAMATGMDLPPMSATEPTTGLEVLFYPHATGSVSWFNPFVRFFPTRDNFYFQLSYFYYAATIAITSRIEDANSQLLTSDGLKGSITIRQFIPTLSIGYIFGNALYFFNMNMGYSFIGATTTTADLTGSFGILGDIPASVLTPIEDGLSSAVNTAADAPKSIVANWPFPSIYFSFGFFF
ncbi:MAG: hypothetical protein HYR96_01240 [Deltaproteobacteria bacterium]|nr:hypothetical protein [Deltaproteobacteria bacterium]MBI3296494.1 hypothetical protein [Deltaproteobacteria bacterium]